MTRDRVYGSDVPFLGWVRACEELPSVGSATCGIGVTDTDALIHRYLTTVSDGPTREVQSIMHIEVKTRSGSVRRSQADTLFKVHVCSCGSGPILDTYVCHWGVSFLFLSGTTPDDSGTMHWGRFGATPQIHRRPITRLELIQLMRFELHPDDLHPIQYLRAGDSWESRHIEDAP